MPTNPALRYAAKKGLSSPQQPTGCAGAPLSPFRPPGPAAVLDQLTGPQPDCHGVLAGDARYGPEVTEALARVWEVGDRMCGKLLVAILPDLLSMSAATIDRRLRGISGDRSVLDLFAPVTRHEPLEASALAAAQ